VKSQHIDRPVLGDQSFSVQHMKDGNEYPTVWHYHKELELVVVVESNGTRFVGDSIGSFVKGDIVLIGQNLPHLWMFDDLKNGKHSKAEIMVVHFDPQFLKLNSVPEFRILRDLFSRAQNGILFEGMDHMGLVNKMKPMMDQSPFERILGLLGLLNLLASFDSQKLLSNPTTTHSFIETNSKLDKVYEYIFTHFREKLSLEILAELACMNSSSFSRYFRNTTKKTLTQFISEIRIGYASKLLVEKKFTISQICFESGFGNISNFNRHFKRIMHMTPKEYINSFH